MIDIVINDGLHALQLVHVKTEMDHDGQVRLQQWVALDMGEERPTVHEVHVVQDACMHAWAAVLSAGRHQDGLHSACRLWNHRNAATGSWVSHLSEAFTVPI